MDLNKSWKGDKPTLEDAETMGTRLAELVAAEIVSQPIRVTVGKFINVGEQLQGHMPEDAEEPFDDESDLYDIMWSNFVSVFKDLLAATPEGMKARMESARWLLEDAATARTKAAQMSIDAVNEHDVGAVPEIELTLRLAEDSLVAANKLFSPILSNINQLVDTAKGVEAMQQVRAQARSQMEDEMHDCKCDDPDCSGHTNH